MTTADALNPAQTTSLVSRLLSLVHAGRLGEAKQMAIDARGAGVRATLVHHLVALALQDERRYADAIDELGVGLELEPDHPGMTTTTGLCLLRLNRHAEAARVLEVAVRLDPNSAEALYGYGAAASRLGALKAARTALDRAVTLDPNHVDALSGLSRLEVRRGEWDAAKAHAERALALSPGQTDAMEILARVELGQKNFESAERRIRVLLERPRLNPEARAGAFILLGDALDGQRRFREAFDAYAKGKSQLGSLHASEFEDTPGKTAPDGVRRILAEFKATSAPSWSSAAVAAKSGGERGHVFLFGFARSGTTLLEQVLATHSDTAVAGELPLSMEADLAFYTRAGDIERLADATSDQLEPLRQSYWKRAREFGLEPAGKVFVDKQPFGATALPLIHKVFPHAKIIFLTRDPRDVVLSCYRRNFNIHTVSYEFTSFERTAVFYDLTMTTIEAFRSVLPLELLQLRYEDLVSDFDSSTRALCSFLELDWTDGLRQFGEGAKFRPITTPSSVQVSRGLYREGVGQWRNYEFAFDRVTPILKPWVEAFGYSNDGM